MNAHSTLLQMLEASANRAPDAPCFTFLVDGDDDRATLTYGQLFERARVIATALREKGLTGERVLIVHAPGIDYNAAFFGCIAAGCIAVPIYPPDPMRLARTLPRLRAVVADCGAQAILTSSLVAMMRSMVTDLAPELDRLHWIASDALPAGSGSDWRRPEPRAEDIAFLQYTSGSTGDPRGVILRNDQVLCNLEALRTSFGVGPGHPISGWTPPYHDMGLVGGVILPVYSLAHCIGMSPLSFLERPERWMKAVSRHRAHMTGAPNFALELAARRTPPEVLATLDLSCLGIVVLGAEMNRASSLFRFTEVFGPAGFSPRAFRPAYGLAEGVVLFSTAPASVETVDRAGIGAGEAVPAEGPDALSFVGCGRPIEAHEFVIADANRGAALADGKVGELWIRGKSVADGYWGHDSSGSFGARLVGDERPWLRTGDLGYARDGVLYLTGRQKEVIIVRGRNHYPTDIEAAAETLRSRFPILRPGCLAAVRASEGEAEGAALVLEIDTKRPEACTPEKLDAFAAELAREVLASCDIGLARVVFVAPRSLPKTSSGKLMRAAAAASLERGELETVRDARTAAEAAPTGRIQLDGRTFVERERLILDALVASLRTRLGGAPVDPERPLVDLGIDSLAAVELAADLEESLGLDTPLGLLLGAGSLEEVARRLAAEGSKRTIAAAAGSCEPWIQRAIRHDSERWPGAHATVVLWRVRGDSLPQALEAALRAVVARHALLGRDAAAAARVEVIDAHGVDEAIGREQVAAFVARPFDLEAGPYLRAALFARGPGEGTLAMALHHLAYDAPSLFALQDQLLAALSGESLPSEVGFYGHYARREAEYLASPRAAEDAAFWHERLAGWPRRVERAGRAPTRRIVGESIAVAPQVTARVKGWAQRLGATPFLGALAIYGEALRSTLAMDRVTLGTTVSQRDRTGLGGVLGPVMNYVPLTLDLRSPSREELLRHVRDVGYAALSRRDYPFGLLAEQEGFGDDEPRLGCEANFNFYDLDHLPLSERAKRLWLGGSVDCGALSVENLPVVEVPAARPYALNLGLFQLGGAWRMNLRYDAGLFDAGEIRAVLRAMADTLETLS